VKHVLRRPVDPGLAALIGMVDHIRRSAPSERHVEGVEDELGAQVRRHPRTTMGGRITQSTPVPRGGRRWMSDKSTPAIRRAITSRALLANMVDANESVGNGAAIVADVAA
jgi:hypothetical protein